MNHSQAREDAQRTAGHMCSTHAVSHSFPIFRQAVLVSALAIAWGISADVHADVIDEPERFESSSTVKAVEHPSDVTIFEGDILLRPEQVKALSNTNSGLRAFGHDRAIARWPNGIVPYGFGQGITNAQRSAIHEAIQHYHDNTRITFVESEGGDEHDTRLVFRPTGGCASYVGRTDFADQDLFVENCSSGSVIHELGHAIGLFHEHTRRDRDNHIQVKWNEIVAGKENNFEILTANAQHLGEYDYGSIMHYGEYFFSKSGAKTIAVPDGVTIGQRSGLSSLDIASINYMYATDLDLSVGTAVSKVSTANDGEIDGLVVDIDVTNNGGLGAHALELVMQLGSDAQWLNISDNSGWDCNARASILTCTAPTLDAGASSNFVVTVNPNGESKDDLSVRLDTRTLDLELSNNAFNDDTPLNGSDMPNGSNNQDGANSQSQTTMAAASTGNSTGSASNNSPTLGAAEGDDRLGGGSSGPLLLSIAGLVLIRRRRTRS
jgi:hypothetical protein